MNIEDIDRAVELRTNLLNAQDLLTEVKDKASAGGKAYIRIAAGNGCYTDVPATAIMPQTWDSIVNIIIRDIHTQVEHCKHSIAEL